MDNQAIKVSVAQDFSVTPGPRYKEEGDFSGEEFRDEVLEGKYQEAREANAKLDVNLDGTLGYGTSFLEEVFGGLARKYPAAEVLETLNIISDEEPYLKDDITGYINEATQ